MQEYSQGLTGSSATILRRRLLGTRGYFITEVVRRSAHRANDETLRTAFDKWNFLNHSTPLTTEMGFKFTSNKSKFVVADKLSSRCLSNVPPKALSHDEGVNRCR
jgi:hypothetical protein